MSQVALTRVVLIDGLRGDLARELPAWSALCARGTSLEVDVGFPTVSLPVEVALWTGLTQQQTGITSNGGEHALAPTLAARGIASVPSQVFGSLAVAENHAWIAGSLGFSVVEDGGDTLKAVRSEAGLVFVHVLRVDAAGHRSGAASDAYRAAARDADAELGRLVAAVPNARWFALSDHGHLQAGGHGGDERALRRVSACIAGPGTDATPRSGPGAVVRAIDVARAIADSTGVRVDSRSRALPLDVAVATDHGEPPLPSPSLAATLVALALLAAGVAVTVAACRARLTAYPWWWPLAGALVWIVRGEPTQSMAITFQGSGWLLASAYGAALPVAAGCAFVAARRVGPVRGAIGQLALPLAATGAAITLAAGWPTVFGGDVSPDMPRYGALAPCLMLAVAHAAVATALGVISAAVAAKLTVRAVARR
nr:alkaline phosphatase family protein [Kofleriaceae bacterium]